MVDKQEKMKENWLTELADKRELWVQEILDQNDSPYPSMIVLKYRQLFNLASDGNIYGILFTAKDLFEVCVKIPVLMALVVIRNDLDIVHNNAYNELMSALVKQPLNAGDWRAVAKHIFSNNDTFNLTHDLSLLLRNTCRLLDHKIGEFPDAIAWRNKTIGHGMVRFEDDPAYKNEIISILQNFKAYFGKTGKTATGELYYHLFFKVNGNPVTGGKRPDHCLTGVELHIADTSYQEKNYILDHDEEILFFESYNKRTKKARYCDYETGIAIEFSNKNFEELYYQYVTGNPLAYRNLETGISHKLTTKEQDLILEYIHHEECFIRPDFLIEQLEDITDTLCSGIIGLQMERGMGKTCLTSRMDTLYNAEPLIEFAEVRTFHLSNPKYTTDNSFINAINENFKRNFNHLYDLRSDEEKLPSIKLNDDKRLAEELGTFLKEYKSIFGCEKLILILDGIDELDEHKQMVLKRMLVSKDLRLSPGCFILITSRLEKEDLNKNKKAFIKELFSFTAKSIIVTRENDLYRGLLLEYLKQNMQGGKEKEFAIILSFSEYRFLYLKGVLRVWNKIDFQNLKTSFFIEFINYIFYLYKGSEKKLTRFLISIALFGSITIKDFVELFSGGILSFQILGIINDVAPLLKENRSLKNSFEFANEMYYGLTIDKFFDEAFADNKEIIMNALFSHVNAHDFRAVYVNMAKSYPKLRDLCGQFELFDRWNTSINLPVDEDIIIRQMDLCRDYSEILYWTCERTKSDLTIRSLENYVYNIDATIYWKEKHWHPDDFIKNGDTIIGLYSRDPQYSYRMTEKTKRLYCSRHVLLLMEMYHLQGRTDKLNELMQLIIKNVQVLDSIVRLRTNDYNYYEDNINEEAYMECVEREYDLLLFRKKIGMNGEYEEYMDKYIACLFSNIKSKLTTGHRAEGLYSILTKYPDSVSDAVSLYLDYFTKTEMPEKGLEECEKIRKLIKIGKKTIFNNDPSSFDDVLAIISETNKNRILNDVSDIVDDYEQDFVQNSKTIMAD